MGSKKIRKFSGVKTPKELNRLFYERFEENYWLNKADALLIMIDFFDYIKKVVADDWNFESPKEKFLMNLRAGIYFTSFHMAEATFALLFAPFQPYPHWVHMTIYKGIRKSIGQYLDDEIAELTSKKCSTKEEFIKLALYSGFFPEGENKKESWNKNVEDIIWMLDRIGNKYMDATGSERGEYNSYKHGLRIQTSKQSLSIYEDGHPERAVQVAPSNDSISYIQFIKKEINKQKVEELSEVTKQFSHVEAYAYIVFMTRILKQIKDTRVALIDGRKTELGRINIDRDKLLELSSYNEWEFTI